MTLTEADDLHYGKPSSSLLSDSMIRSKLLYSMLLNGNRNDSHSDKIQKTSGTRHQQQPHSNDQKANLVMGQALKTKKIRPKLSGTQPPGGNSYQNTLKQIYSQQLPLKIHSPRYENDQGNKSKRNSSPKGQASPSNGLISAKLIKPNGLQSNWADETPKQPILFPKQKASPTSMTMSKSVASILLDSGLPFKEAKNQISPRGNFIFSNSKFKQRESSPPTSEISANNHPTRHEERNKLIESARADMKSTGKSRGTKGLFLPGKFVQNEMRNQVGRSMMPSTTKMNNFF